MSGVKLDPFVRSKRLFWWLGSANCNATFFATKLLTPNLLIRLTMRSTLRR